MCFKAIFLYSSVFFFTAYYNLYALCMFVCVSVFVLPCVIAILTLCNRLIMYRLQIILFHCKENGCLVFLAPWLFQTASPINNY